MDKTETIKVQDLKIGDEAYRKKDHDSWIEWIKFIVSEEYLELIKEFPEDYSVNHPTKSIIQQHLKDKPKANKEGKEEAS